jgi:outer membrane lipoprotein-sorting protein
MILKRTKLNPFNSRCCLLIFTVIFSAMIAGTIIFKPGILKAEQGHPDPETLVQKAFDYLRSSASESTVDMTIHRPAWERTVTIKAWTQGTAKSLFTILAPPKDQGNGTLKIGSTMWMYNPKINRVIKLPPSMMSQSWMGSDFSNNDLAKSDTLINDYTHTVTGSKEIDGVTVFDVVSIPLPEAPVIWGKIELKIREDLIMLEETFFDEDMKPVKQMTTEDVRMMSGRLFPARWKMRKTDSDDEYTLLTYREIIFEASLKDALFSLEGLKKTGR